MIHNQLLTLGSEGGSCPSPFGLEPRATNSLQPPAHPAWQFHFSFPSMTCLGTIPRPSGSRPAHQVGKGVAASPRTDSGSRGIAAAKMKQGWGGGCAREVDCVYVYIYTHTHSLCGGPPTRAGREVAEHSCCLYLYLYFRFYIYLRLSVSPCLYLYFSISITSFQTGVGRNCLFTEGPQIPHILIYLGLSAHLLPRIPYGSPHFARHMGNRGTSGKPVDHGKSRHFCDDPRSS